jgi:phosphatidylinositol alpha-1,6-mannosyltransferase
MRILVLIPDGFGGRGGIAKFNRDFLTALCTHPQYTEVVAIPRRIVDKIESLPHKLTYVTSGLKYKVKYGLTILRNTLLTSKFDLIICGHINLLPFAYLVKLWTKAPIVMIMHGIEIWQPSPSRLANNLVNKIDAVISVSELTKERFLKWAKLNNIQEFILPNTVKLDDYQPAPKNPQLLEHYQLQGKTVIITLGRLDHKERYKGFDQVLEVLPSLISEIPNLVYMIVGEGGDRQRLEEKAKTLGVDKNVIFTGFVSELEKANYYRLADAFVMPSKGEGFGIVFLEAMSCGVPVVGSKIDGSKEALRNGALGILVNPDDLEEVKMGIMEAIESPKGKVPDGLDYFSQENFEARCHYILNSLFEPSYK